MANHEVQPVCSTNVQYILPGEESELRVEDSTELIYLEEGAELNTQFIDGVEYLFVDENQQVVHPMSTEQEEVQYVEQNDGTCIQYVKLEDNNSTVDEAMQYINTVNGETPLFYGAEYLQEESYVTDQNTQYVQEMDVEYVEAPTLEPEVPFQINSDAGTVESEYHYIELEPPMLEPEIGDSEGLPKQFASNMETESMEDKAPIEPLYIQHEGVLYQINDPALMTPESLNTIKETLLQTTTEGESDKENNTEPPENSQTAQVLCYDAGTQFEEYTLTDNSAQLYNLVNDPVKHCHNPTSVQLNNTFSNTSGKNYSHSIVKPNINLRCTKNGVRSLVNQNIHEEQQLVNSESAPLSYNIQETLVFPTSKPRASFTEQKSEIRKKEIANMSAKKYPENVNGIVQRQGIKCQVSSALSVVKRQESAINAITPKSAILNGYHNGLNGMSVKKLSPTFNDNKGTINTPTVKYTSVKKVYDPSSGVPTLNCGEKSKFTYSSCIKSIVKLNSESHLLNDKSLSHQVKNEIYKSSLRKDYSCIQNKQNAIYRDITSKSVKQVDKVGEIKKNSMPVNGFYKSAPLTSTPKLNDNMVNCVKRNNRLSLENYIKSKLSTPKLESTWNEDKDEMKLVKTVMKSVEEPKEINWPKSPVIPLEHDSGCSSTKVNVLEPKFSEFMCQVNMDTLGKVKVSLNKTHNSSSKISDTQRTYDHRVHIGTQINFNDLTSAQTSQDEPIFDMECEEIEDRTLKKTSKNEKTLIGRGSQSNSPQKESPDEEKTSADKNNGTVESQVADLLKSKLAEIDSNRNSMVRKESLIIEKLQLSPKAFYKSCDLKNLKGVSTENINSSKEAENIDLLSVNSSIKKMKKNKVQTVVPKKHQVFLEKSKYEAGQDCKARYSDGNVYDGIITQVDDSNQRCYIDFLDKGCAWCDFKDVENVYNEDEIEEDEYVNLLCTMCQGGSSTVYNEIVICDGCGQGYHQKCHSPAVDSSVTMDVDSEWVCSTCRPPSPLNFNITPLPYNPTSLTWNNSHTENAEKCYCYCGKMGTWFMQMLQCRKCLQWFHQDCVGCLSEALIMGDQFYVFVCNHCNRGTEFLHRLHLRWVDIVHLAIFHLGLSLGKKQLDLEENIWPWVNKHWHQLIQSNSIECNKQRRLLKLHEALTDIHCTKRFRQSRDYKKKSFGWSLKLKSPPSAPVVKMPLIKPLTKYNTANFKWKMFQKLPNTACEPIKWNFARPTKLKVQKKRKYSESSDTETCTKKRKLTENQHEKTGKSRVKSIPPPPKYLLEKLVPVQCDYEYTNHPFLLDVERTELEERGLKKAGVVEKTAAVTLLTVTDNTLSLPSNTTDNVEEEDEPYTVLAKRTYPDDQLQYLIHWSS